VSRWHLNASNITSKFAVVAERQPCQKFTTVFATRVPALPMMRYAKIDWHQFLSIFVTKTQYYNTFFGKLSKNVTVLVLTPLEPDLDQKIVPRALQITHEI
jgi:hypothetical protein